MFGWSEVLANTQKGAAWPRISFNLFRGRAHRLSRKYTDSIAGCAMFAGNGIDGGLPVPVACLPSLRFANAPSGLAPETALHYSIFKRVEGDDRQPPSLNQCR